MLGFKLAAPDRYKLLKEFARENRKNATDAEYVLWQRLRANALGHKFSRQFVIDDYIVDFVCHDDGLIVEVDGAYHSEPQQEMDDEERTKMLERYGFHVMRFSNEDVLYDTDSVVEQRLDFLE